MRPLLIRGEEPSYIPAVARLIEDVFNLAPYTSHTEHFIVQALRKAGALRVSLLAEQSGQIVGHVAISPVTTSSLDQNWFGLGPISVKPEDRMRASDQGL